jgi:hypothetical protein
MAKVRLQGTPEEVNRLAAVLEHVHGLQVVQRSPTYPNRVAGGGYRRPGLRPPSDVRVYLEVRLR